MKFRFHPEANREMAASARYYEECVPGLGIHFLDELYASIGILLQFPESGSPISKGCRKFVISGFPYNLVYQSKGETILIIAVMHQHRKPGYWKKRA